MAAPTKNHSALHLVFEDVANAIVQLATTS
jgi:hypothetical protein